jgi:hypothetical protein
VRDEVTLFVKNLVENTDIEGCKIIIEMNKTQGRELESIFSFTLDNMFLGS